MFVILISRIRHQRQHGIFLPPNPTLLNDLERELKRKKGEDRSSPFFVTAYLIVSINVASLIRTIPKSTGFVSMCCKVTS